MTERWKTNQVNNVSRSLARYIVGLVLVLSIISSFLSIRAVYEDGVEDANISAETAMRQMVRMLDASFADIETLTMTASKYVEGSIPTSESCYDFLRQMMQADTSLSAACFMFREYYYPDKGREFSPSVYLHVDSLAEYDAVEFGYTYYEDENEENWRAGVEGRTYWSVPYYAVNSQTNVNELRVAYSVPLYDDSGFYGVLCTVIRLNNLDKVFDRYRPYEECEVRLISNNTGKYILHPDTTKLLNVSLYDEAVEFGGKGLEELVECVKSGSDGRFILDRNGTEWCVYATQFTHAGWSVIISYPMSLINREPRHITFIMLVVSLVTLILLFVLIQWVISSILKPYTANVKKMAEESASIGRDLQIASQMQMEMLPKSSMLKLCDSLDVHGMLVPARQVGGDLYDYFFKDGRFYFCVGDVSGKGVTASMFMVEIRTLLHEIASTETRVESIMRKLNMNMLQNNSSNMFCTMFLGVINVTTGEMSYCDAGHNPPVYLHRDGLTAYLNTDSDDVIGLFPESTYHSVELRLEPGDGLFLYTDGVTEAENPERSLFGESATLDVLNSLPGASSEEIVGTILDAVRSFSSGAEQSDDITMLVVRYLGSDNESLNLTNDISRTPELGKWVETVCRKYGMTEEKMLSVKVAVEEAVVNVMNYAYPGQTEMPVTVTAGRTEESVTFTVLDCGRPYDPLANDDPDLDRPVDEMEVGGLGVYLYKELLTDVSYRYENGRNILTLIV